MAGELRCGSRYAIRAEHRQAGSIELTEAVYAARVAVPAHYHATARVCLVLDGGYEERFPGTSFRCEPGSVVFTPPGEVHSDRFGGRGGRCFTAAIPFSILHEWAEGSDARAPLASRQGGPNRLAFELLAGAREGTISGADAEDLLFGLFDDLHVETTVHSEGRPPAWLVNLRDRVHEEYRTPPSLRALAQDAGVHHVHAARAFKRHYGCTIGEYARRRRVEHACSRLHEPAADLAAVAYDAGFADQAHMTRVVRRYLGLTPGAFRRRYAT